MLFAGLFSCFLLDNRLVGSKKGSFSFLLEK